MGMIMPGEDPLPTDQLEPGREIKDDDKALAAWVRRTCGQLWRADRDTALPQRVWVLLQYAITRAVEEGHAILAAHILTAVLVDERRRDAHGLLLQQILVDCDLGCDLIIRKCRVCGCSDGEPCEGGCGWEAWDLCTRCAAAERVAPQAAVDQ